MIQEIIDSHCHLDFPKFNRDRQEAIKRAQHAGVVEFINSGVDQKTNLSTLALASEYERIHATLGPGVAANRKKSYFCSRQHGNISTVDPHNHTLLDSLMSERI
jgi:Tat protein secretion system quality control protein TatD with DNase activity